MQKCPRRSYVMSSPSRIVDLTQVCAVPWAWVDEHVYTAIRGCSLKTLQRERRLNIRCEIDQQPS